MAKDLYIFPRVDLTRINRLHVKLYAKPVKRNNALIYYTIILRVSLSEQRYNTTLCNVEPEAWNPEQGVIRNDYTTTKGVPTVEINRIVERIRCELREYAKELTPEKIISIEDAKRITKSILGRPVTIKTLSADYFDYITERSRSKGWSEKNFLREKRILRLFVNFAGERMYDSFSPTFIEEFAIHLKNSGLRDENVKKMVTSVNGFLQWSKRHGKDIPSGRFVYKYTKVEKPVLYLSKDELRRICNFTIPQSGSVMELHSMRGRLYEKKVEGAESMAIVRDFLLFCCLTGLRYSELQMLQKNHIKNNALCFVTPKTDTPRSIELNKFSLALIEKYAKYPNNKEYLFPRLSNQKANKHLHDLAELCEINEPVFSMTLENGIKTERMVPKYDCITTHIGRKTFVCQALLSGLSPELITMWTGHASVDDMRPYMAAASEAKKQGMNRMYTSLISSEICP